MSRNTTFVEMAKKLGVSHTTVSRAYYGKEGVSEETRMRVMEAARHLNLPIPQQKEASIPATAPLFICTSSWEEMPPTTFHSLVVKGLHDTLENYDTVNYRFISLDKLEHKENPDAVIQRLSKARVVIFLQQSDPEVVKGLLDNKVHVILSDHEHEGLSLESVTSDNIYGGMLAARYLLERGHRRIGWVCLEKHSSWEQRLIGVRAELAAWNLTLATSDCRYMEAEWPEGATRIVGEWLADGSLPPALIVPASHMAFTFDRALMQSGKQWGKDLSLVCFDNDFLINMCMIPPTRVATDPYKIGRCIVEQALQFLSHPDMDRSYIKHIVPVQLIEGKSVVTVG